MPRGWQQEPLRLIVRRVRIPVEELSEDPRSRRRRTVPQAQLELALEGRVEYVYAYSFILTDLEGDAAEIEHWHRQRAQIEERVKEAELGDGLLHFPLGTLDANRVWQTARVIAHNLVALLSAVVADVNHHRLREQLEQSPEPPPRPAAARVANHNTKLVRRWLLACPGGSCTAAAGWCCGSPRAALGRDLHRRLPAAAPAHLQRLNGAELASTIRVSIVIPEHGRPRVPLRRAGTPAAGPG